MRYIRRSIAYGEILQLRAATEFVSRLSVTAVKREIPALAGRLFVFFLDDYTEERVPLALQKNLHILLFVNGRAKCLSRSRHTCLRVDLQLSSAAST